VAHIAVVPSAVLVVVTLVVALPLLRSGIRREVRSAAEWS
jgi:hypothetical protein